MSSPEEGAILEKPAVLAPADASVPPSHTPTVEQTSEETPGDADEETRLKHLTVAARDQDELERDIGREADQLLVAQADERDKKQLAKAEQEIKAHKAAIEKLRNRLIVPFLTEVKKVKIRAEIKERNEKIVDLERQSDDIQTRINERHRLPGEKDEVAAGANIPLPNESRRDFLIRTGKITPFSKIGQTDGARSTLLDTMLDAEVDDLVEEASKSKGPMSHQNLMNPGFVGVSSTSEGAPSTSEASTARSTKSRRVTRPDVSSPETASGPASPASDDAYTPDMSDRELAALGESEDASEAFDDDEYEDGGTGRKRKVASKKGAKAKSKQKVEEKDDLAGVDDGNERVFKARIRKWSKARADARKRAQQNGEVDVEAMDEDEDECYLPHPTYPDTDLGDDFRIPGDIYPALFDYQKTGVQWLWELYSQHVGGIVGDEMGLGKTIQAIAFVAGLHYSKKLTKPVIVVCPATVMKQWVNEFHRWWPALRVSILHSSGSGMLDTGREDRMEREMELRDFGEYDNTLTNAGKAAKKIVEKVKREGHVLVTTYSGLQTYAEFLIPVEWETAILDEGHKIKNPNTSITIRCKQLRTPSRIILSGTPMQNSLTELWSLFDFVFPMRLGTLVNFRNEFEYPIKRGGYANASNLDFETAKHCAETLKDAIAPYLLQRLKVDVAADLPQKKERVLFCKLTVQQRKAYTNFLNSQDMTAVHEGKRNMLFGVDYLRKICNHPDLVDHKENAMKPGYGAASKSGKMQVVKELLSLWTKGGHKTLLFAQHRIMLDILEKFINTLPGINYRRMDGATAIKNRQDMVDEFNNSPDIHVFLLTTKVGGLGVNLTGANRVIIYDPDWNPSTDVQARERSWRLGQKRDVEIYRLMCAGTIEEKIYHRQIFKQFLTNKVMKDPGQRQQFQMSDLHDLFSLSTDREDGETETGNLFRGSERRTTPEATAPEDLAAMRAIHHAEIFRTGGDDEASKKSDGEGENNGDGKKPARSDERLMSTIFAKSGVHSVVEHDAIVNSTSGGRKRKVQADPAWIQREAKRQATAAAEELRRAEQQARQTPIGVPTWTGMYGEAGRPEPPRPRGQPAARGGRGGGAAGRGGPSSSLVLSNLAARQGRSDPNSRASTPNRSGTSTPPGASPAAEFRGRRMLEKIREFLITHGGSVPTQMLVDHFDRWVRQGPPGTSDEFTEMLRVLARLEKGTAGRGRARWVLKDEWRRTGENGGGTGSAAGRARG